MIFENLSDRLQGIFKKLRGHGKLTEDDVSDAMREVRMALLEADVNFKVVKDFVKRVKERAVGQEVLDTLTAARAGGVKPCARGGGGVEGGVPPPAHGGAGGYQDR